MSEKTIQLYQVTWQADVLAESHKDAALQAIDYIMVGGVRTFEVKENLTDDIELVDLSDPKEDKDG